MQSLLDIKAKTYQGNRAQARQEMVDALCGPAILAPNVVEDIVSSVEKALRRTMEQPGKGR